MKCEICGIETPSGPLTDRATGLPALGEVAALTISTNSQYDAENFLGIFGIWDQREKSMFQICGACLVDSLKMLPRSRIEEAGIPICDLTGSSFLAATGLPADETISVCDPPTMTVTPKDKT